MPRKYSEGQRTYIRQLAAAGSNPREIAERCAAGSPDLEPFSIPRRTVAHIVTNAGTAPKGPAPKDETSPDVLGALLAGRLSWTGDTWIGNVDGEWRCQPRDWNICTCQEHAAFRNT